MFPSLARPLEGLEEGITVVSRLGNLWLLDPDLLLAVIAGRHIRRMNIVGVSESASSASLVSLCTSLSKGHRFMSFQGTAPQPADLSGVILELAIS